MKFSSERLRHYVQQGRSWLKEKWQHLQEKVRFRRKTGDTQAALPKGGRAAAKSGVPARLEQLREREAAHAELLHLAEQSFSGKPLQGKTYERTCQAGTYAFSLRRDYLVYTPKDYRSGEPLPLLVVLHGCQQTHHNIRAVSGFDFIADRERFIVVYPFVTSYLPARNLNCWGWWIGSHASAGSGEVEDVGRIVRQVQEEFSIDPQRIHITGLSSGAGMTVAALVAHGRLFASGASVAGVAYAETLRAVNFGPFVPARYRPLAYSVKRMRAQVLLHGRGQPAPLLVVQSMGDETVPPQGGLKLRDSWLKYKKLKPSPTDTLQGKTRGIRWQYQSYARPGRTDSVVDYLEVEQLAHGWVGGLPGEFSDVRGPNISELIWLHCRKHH